MTPQALVLVTSLLNSGSSIFAGLTEQKKLNYQAQLAALQANTALTQAEFERDAAIIAANIEKDKAAAAAQNQKNVLIAAVIITAILAITAIYTLKDK